MKNIKLISIALIFFTTFSNAQIVGQNPARNVPIMVAEAFTDKFGEQDVIWFENYQGKYDQRLIFEGRFRFDNRYSAAMYDKDGNMVAFAAHIEPREVPADALKYMSDNYPTFPIMDAMLVTSPADGVNYELGIVVDGEYIISLFSEDGKFIKTVKA